MMMNSPSMPPPVPLSDEAMKLAAVLLAVASDPAGTKSRLDELNAATTTLRAEIDGHAAAAKTAQDAAAALADVEQRAKDLAAREDALIAAQTRLNVASGAIADRDAQLQLREAAFDKRQVEIATKEQALADKVEKYRAALTA